MNSTSTNHTNPFAKYGIFIPAPTPISQETQTSTPHTVTKTTQTTQTQLKKRHFTQTTATLSKSIDKSKMTNRDFFMGFIDPLIFIMGYGSVLLICITLTYFLSIFIF